MPTSKKNSGPSASQQETLNALPQEWQQLAKEFKQQSEFFDRFVTQYHDSEHIKSFWNMPSSMGFSDPKKLKEQNPWFQTLFELSQSADQLGLNFFESFSAEIQTFTTSIQQEIVTFQKAAQGLTALQQDMANRAFELFESKLTSIDREDTEQLCRAWLQAGETAYQELSEREEFSHLQSELMNSVSKLKQIQSNMANRFSVTFGLPTHLEISELQQGLHDLRMAFAEHRMETTKQIRALQAQLDKPAARKKNQTPTSS